MAVPALKTKLGQFLNKPYRKTDKNKTQQSQQHIYANYDPM